jgi:hypothetical protein
MLCRPNGRGIELLSLSFFAVVVVVVVVVVLLPFVCVVYEAKVARGRRGQYSLPQTPRAKKVRGSFEREGEG